MGRIYRARVLPSLSQPEAEALLTVLLEAEATELGDNPRAVDAFRRGTRRLLDAFYAAEKRDVAAGRTPRREIAEQAP